MNYTTSPAAATSPTAAHYDYDDEPFAAYEFYDWNETDFPSLEASRCEGALYLWTSIVIGVLGVVGLATNCLVLMVIMNRNYPSSHVNIYIASLAVADAIYVASTSVWTISSQTLLLRPSAPAWLLRGSAFYAIFGFFSTGSIHFSIWTIALLSLNRLIAVCWPLRFSVVYTRRNVVFQLIGLGVITISVNAFENIYQNVHEEDFNHAVYHAYLKLAEFTFVLFLPWLTICGSTVVIVARFCKNENETEQKATIYSDLFNEKLRRVSVTWRQINGISPRKTSSANFRGNVHSTAKFENASSFKEDGDAQEGRNMELKSAGRSESFAKEKPAPIENSTEKETTTPAPVSLAPTDRERSEVEIKKGAVSVTPSSASMDVASIKIRTTGLRKESYVIGLRKESNASGAASTEPESPLRLRKESYATDSRLVTRAMDAASKERRERLFRRLTRMCVAICLLFVIVAIPNVVHSLIVIPSLITNAEVGANLTQEQMEFQMSLLLMGVDSFPAVIICYLIGANCNFFLYIYFNTNFKTVLKSHMIQCGGKGGRSLTRRQRPHFFRALRGSTGVSFYSNSTEASALRSSVNGRSQVAMSRIKSNSTSANGINQCDIGSPNQI